ncbi:aminotransferase class IV [Micropruina sp.]|uniref:aminotransferase class IV n=1 Tax=Micropruina sp. TaxID=2737536 RepID=UPI0039E36674
MTTFAYLDGQWVDAARPQLALSTQGLQYGTAVFEGIRAYRTDDGAIQPFEPRAHFDRLHTSCQSLRMDLRDTSEQLARLCTELLERNNIDDDCYVRPVAFKTAFLPGTPFGVRLAGVDHSLAMTCVRMPSRLGHPSRLGISTVRRVPDVAMPTRAKISGAYVASARAIDECTARGYDDAILLTVEGRVAEASTSNILLRSGRTLVTPALDQGILPGITRSLVLTIARDQGLEVVERPVEIAELFTADEILLTGTGLEISPVISIEGRTVADGACGEFTLRACASYKQRTRTPY